jgi:hypothetical protein
MTRSKNAGGEMAQAQQLDLQHITAGQRANSGRGAGENHIARLQAEVPGHVGDQRQNGIEHVAAVAVLAHFAVDAQADANVGLGLDCIPLHERRQHAGTVEAFGDFPGQALCLESGLHIAQGQIQRRSKAADGVAHFLEGRLSG